MDRRTSILVLIVAVSLTCLATWKSAQAGSQEFTNWKKEHNVHYSSQQQNDYREKIFLQNMEDIRSHNENPQRTYNKGANQFTALSKEQFVATYLYDVSLQNIKKRAIISKQPTEENLQIEDVDWVEKGAVNSVRNQGQCTSGSWAFSATGSLEALNQISTGILKKFSEQQLIDCTGTLCSCSGGFTDMAFRYVESHGLCQEKDYPYTEIKQSCKPTQGSFRVSDYDYVDNCNGLGKLIARAPLSVAVDATGWQSYVSGVFADCTTKINTMALLVGVVEGNWKVKNSWGKTWGQQGFIRLASGNTCGICSIALYPIK